MLQFTSSVGVNGAERGSGCGPWIVAVNFSVLGRVFRNVCCCCVGWEGVGGEGESSR